jgi:hypothetical protein
MTSPLKSFATRMHAQAASIIGSEPIIIDGATFMAILADQDAGLDFSDGRNEPEKRLVAVLPASSLSPVVRLNALVSARGQNWRLDRIDNAGGTFATLQLTSETRA